MIKINRNSKGFTLIELLIVIAIIGILAAIAIPAYSGYTKKSKVAGVVSAMGAIKNAVAAYYTEAGAGVAAAGIAAVGTAYGVTPPGQYISAMDVTATGNISTTLTNIGGDVNGTTLTMSTTDQRAWTWGGTLPDAYKPKSN
jgi:type IV pilus assembly protein PilA